MPELPRVLGLEVERALERPGFRKVRQSGSHVVMKRELKGCVVPMHGEVKIGTLAGAGALRQASVPAEEFIQTLRRMTPYPLPQHTGQSHAFARR